MKRRTIKIGADAMLEVELSVHGWEVAILDRNGVYKDLYIEADLAARDKRIEDVGGRLVLAAFK